MDLSTRADLPELMDSGDLDISEYRICLADLAAVNRITQTHRCTLQFLQNATRSMLPGTRISVLDLAFGHGDLLRAISKWGAKRRFDLSLTGVDLNPRSAMMAGESTPPGQDIEYRVGDVFAYEPMVAPDFIVTSQFTHHLSDPQIERLLRWMDSHALKGWHIADLHRHVFPYYAFRLLCRIMGWHKIVRYDGTVSIARSFRKDDWQRYLARTGLQADISWQPVFRYAVSRLK